LEPLTRAEICLRHPTHLNKYRQMLRTDGIEIPVSP
jgi:hypothetical protein